MSSFSFFFYDLETSGFNPRHARIMQFAGQRTDLDLKPVGEPVNQFIKLTPDVLPDPGAVLVTGITPQKTLEDGLREAEFTRLFQETIALPNTIFVGYNSIRFDDEFKRFLMWRNFYDPYEWEWKNGAGRWDLLDVARMTRALRPEGINWPKDQDGNATNKLELLTAANKISHAEAHDALSDVKATIELAKLIKQTQPKLFEFLLDNRTKQQVAQIVNSAQPFVYTSGKYPSEFEKTTVVTKLADNANNAALVYDLRHDPDEFIKLSPQQLVERWKFIKDQDDAPARLPVKTVKFNRCPAIAPMGVLDKLSQKRLNLDLKVIDANRYKLANNRTFTSNLLKAVEIMEQDRQEAKQQNGNENIDAEARLYDGFVNNADKPKLAQARQMNTKPGFSDERLAAMWTRYKARNYPDKLSPKERESWDKYYQAKLIDGGESSQLANYFKAINQLSEQNSSDSQQKFLLEELQLYGESLLPSDF